MLEVPPLRPTVTFSITNPKSGGFEGELGFVSADLRDVVYWGTYILLISP